jgi:hypothetical protein
MFCADEPVVFCQLGLTPSHSMIWAVSSLPDSGIVACALALGMDVILSVVHYRAPTLSGTNANRILARIREEDITA